MSLKKAALSGMFWTFIQQMSTQGISFVVSIILARILLPSEFGLIALISVFIAIGNALIDSGLNQSLIRTEHVTEKDYSAVFFFNLIISICIYVIMFFTAPFISNFYNQQLLTEISRVYGLVFIINSLAVVQNTKLTKELQFKKQTIITLPSLLIGSSVGIWMAIKGYGVWSLVWSNITRSAALTIQLWLWSPWKPSLDLKWNNIQPHLNFGYKLTMSSLIHVFFTNIYTIIIGKFFDPIQVGFYNRANTLKQMPVQNFSAVLSKVTFPLFSKIQDDNKQLKSAYKKIMKMAIFLLSPTLLLMAVLAEPLFRFLITEKWLPAVPYFQILCLSGILYPINIYNLNILNVKGRSDLYLKLEVIKKIFALFVIIISINWGIYGLLYGHLFLTLTGLLINTHYAGKHINYSTFNQLRDISPAFFISLLTSVIIFLEDRLLVSYNYSDIIRLLTGGIMGIILFLILSYLFKLSSLYEIKSILVIAINKKRLKR
ncbi:MAG: lipopolysaccharide biosynthesis protein [Flavobacteriales bacterium]|nr:lipopolysaccharide biosynthesis protein [Flavobacteriales bacterium]MCB9365425.1 lipopolysaccharide biosynthesis protein [Flavobacteriales bacterium]